MSENKETESQNRAICNHLRNGGAVTSLSAVVEFGCLRLAARVFDLKEKGFHIEDRWINKNGKRYKEYYIPMAQPKSSMIDSLSWVRKPLDLTKSKIKEYFLEA